MPTIDVSLLDEQIAALEAHLEKCNATLAEYEAFVSAERGEAETTATKLAALREFRTFAFGNSQLRQRARLADPDSCRAIARKKPKASAAIMDLLRQHPEGMKRGAIIAAVLPRMNSIAANPKHIIRTTLFNMKRSERLKYDEETEIYRLPIM